MKPELNRKYNTIAAYVLVVAAILISYILIFVYWNEVKVAFDAVLVTVSPFIYGFVIAYILNPVYNLFTAKYSSIVIRKKRMSRRTVKTLAVITAYLLALLLLALFFYIIIPQLWDSVMKLINRFPGYIEAVEDLLEINLAETFPLIPDGLFGNTGADIMPGNSELSVPGAQSGTQPAVSVPGRPSGEQHGALVQWLETMYNALVEYTPKVFSVVTVFATQVWNFILGFIISIYMLSDKHKFAHQFKKIIYSVFKKKRADTIVAGVKKTHETFGGFLNGKILDSFIIGVLCFIGMSVLRIPYTPLVSVVVGVTNVIPYFGPFLGAIPSIFIILLEDPIKALWFAIFILILQQLDGNVIGPKIIGEKIGLSSFWVIFALLIMGSVMGVFGLLLAVPFFALIYEFVKFLCNKALEKKGYNIVDGDVVIVSEKENSTAADNS